MLPEKILAYNKAFNTKNLKLCREKFCSRVPMASTASSQIYVSKISLEPIYLTTENRQTKGFST